MSKKITITFIVTLVLVSVLLFGVVQAATSIRQIGILWPDSPPSPRIEEFKQGLRDLGYVEGKNVIIHYKYANGARDKLPVLAAELVALNVDVIVALTTIAAEHAKKATKTIPIIIVSGDPVGTGMVASLARPGGNITGLASFAPELVGKRLELLKEIVPGLSRVAVLWDAEGPAKILEMKAAEAAGRTMGIRIQSLPVRDPKPDIEGAFKAAAINHAEAVITLGNPLTLTSLEQIVDLTRRYQLPSIFDSKQFVESGGLISYGPDFTALYKRAAIYVDRILKGAKPAELPVELPTRFDLIINLKTAKKLGVTIPPYIQAQATRVIN